MPISKVTTGSITDSVAIDTDTLVVDGVNNRIGVGTTSPSYKTEISDGTVTFGVNPLSAYSTVYAGTTTNHGMNFITNGNSRLNITSAGAVGIGTSSPVASSLLTLKETNAGGDGAELRLINSSTTVESATQIVFTNTTTDTADSAVIKAVRTASGQDFRFSSDGTERLRIDSVGNVSLGNGKFLQFKDSGGTARDVITIDAFNGLNINSAGGGSAAPIVFKSNNAEKMRINSDGRVTVSNSNVTNPNVVSSSSETFTMSGALGIVNQSNTPMGINRDGNDGDLIAFRQATVKEGGISVSGTTVSYNGGHLSRWSQLADNTKDETIVKGTVLTNLDQMAVWTNDGVTEENEQLNCMAVSSVEGDPNVAGVFVNWDEDDDIYTNDMNVAMTGDMVIRITSGTTVARGDLLMSAGDGTAKPQGDDIVRSKTIAKVTSTHVSHTYGDGSYLVPCVLMAC